MAYTTSNLIVEEKNSLRNNAESKWESNWIRTYFYNEHNQRSYMKFEIIEANGNAEISKEMFWDYYDNGVLKSEKTINSF